MPSYLPSITGGLSTKTVVVSVAVSKRPGVLPETTRITV